MALTQPPIIYQPFCSTGNQTPPPLTSTGATDPTTNQQDGFTPYQARPFSLGGAPLLVEQMNGVLNFYTKILEWINAGGTFTFDATFSTQNGGYPAGVILWCASNNSYQRSLVNNNTANFVATPSYINDGINWKTQSAFMPDITDNTSTGTVSVTGPGGLNVTNNSTFQSDIKSYRNIFCSNNLGTPTITMTSTGNLSANGGLTANGLTINNTATISSYVVCNGVQSTGNISVGSGNITLYPSGNIVANGNIGANIITCNGFQTTGAITVSGDINKKNSSGITVVNIDNAGNILTSGTITAQTNANVTGSIFTNGAYYGAGNGRINCGGAGTANNLGAVLGDLERYFTVISNTDSNGLISITAPRKINSVSIYAYVMNGYYLLVGDDGTTLTFQSKSFIGNALTNVSTKIYYSYTRG